MLFRSELEAFADAVERGVTYPVPPEDAIHGIEVMEAAIRSGERDAEKVAIA